MCVCARARVCVCVRARVHMSVYGIYKNFLAAMKTVYDINNHNYMIHDNIVSYYTGTLLSSDNSSRSTRATDNHKILFASPMSLGQIFFLIAVVRD